MDSEIIFNYFYGNEVEQFCFYRIPKMLVTDDYFKQLSTDAKLLYGLLLDRMGLSIKNGWCDSESRVYIYFTVEDVMVQLNCKSEKATKLFAELDSIKGIGLIERVRQGQGKPSRIYVKQFIMRHSVPTKATQHLRLSEIEKPEFENSNLQTFENQKSRLSESENPEIRLSNGNNTDIIKPELNESNLSIIESALHPSRLM